VHPCAARRCDGLYGAESFPEDIDRVCHDDVALVRPYYKSLVFRYTGITKAEMIRGVNQAQFNELTQPTQSSDLNTI